jgi:hypothetical protein
MTQKPSTCESPGCLCTVRIDRVQHGADSWSNRRLRIAGFRVERDTFVRQQTTTLRAYTRLKNLKNLRTGTTVAIQYQTACTWLPGVKATVNAGREHELCRTELETIFEAFDKPSLLLTELALDFPSDSDIDRAFVRAHGIFGKCQRSRRFPTDRTFSNQSSDFARTEILD